MDPNTGAPAPKKSGKKKWLWLLLVLIIAAGVAAYFVNKHNDDKKKAQQAAAVQQLKNQQQSANTNSFNPESMANVPYVATVSTTTGGKKTSAVMTSDGQGNISYVYSLSGQQATLVYTKDAYYLCMGTQTCIKYSLSQSSTSGVDPSTYQYDSSKIANLKNSANYQGQQACPAPATGTCDVWQVSNSGVTSTMYINTSTKRIARVTTASGTTSSDITYDYKNATVTVPTKFTTLSNNH